MYITTQEFAQPMEILYKKFIDSFFLSPPKGLLSYDSEDFVNYFAFLKNCEILHCDVRRLHGVIMLERNIEGYNLIEITSDNWCIETVNGRKFSGTFLEVAMYAVIKLGFKINEIDLAVQDMVKNGNNAAHFGMWACFIFSFSTGSEIRKAS